MTENGEKDTHTQALTYTHTHTQAHTHPHTRKIHKNKIVPFCKWLKDI